MIPFTLVLSNEDIKILLCSGYHFVIWFTANAWTRWNLLSSSSVQKYLLMSPDQSFLLRLSYLFAL